MTPLEKLNRRMLQLENDGHLSEADYATYKALLDASSGQLDEAVVRDGQRVRANVLYALMQGQLYPATKDQNALLENIVEELSKLGLIDYAAAGKELSLDLL